MKYPLFNQKINIPKTNSPGSFGYKRSYYYHPGIDLYCDKDQEVIAIEDGTVVNIEIFTGPDANPPSPWWNETWSIMIEGRSGVIGYCELKPMFYIVEGMKIKEGDMIGRIIPVLKKDKGNGTTMLHLEHYSLGTKNHVTWHIGKDKPKELLDPIAILIKIKNQNIDNE